jgi:hypothetical protein
MVKPNALAELSTALELARPDVDAADLEILDIDGRTIWPMNREESSHGFYIGKKGAPTWDATQWLGVPILLPMNPTTVTARAVIGELVAKAIREIKAPL